MKSHIVCEFLPGRLTESDMESEPLQVYTTTVLGRPTGLSKEACLYVEADCSIICLSEGSKRSVGGRCEKSRQ